MTLGGFTHYFNFYFFRLKLIFSIILSYFMISLLSLILYFIDNKYTSKIPNVKKTEL